MDNWKITIDEFRVFRVVSLLLFEVVVVEVGGDDGVVDDMISAMPYKARPSDEKAIPPIHNMLAFW